MTWTNERTLDERDLEAEPYLQFRKWLEEARAAGERMPHVMALATCSSEPVASVRMVLVDTVDERGFTFQTNLESPKARDLTAVPHAAAVFFWPGLVRQVRISGPVEPLSREEVAAYFGAAPAGIQAMLRACRQSEVVPNRATLERSFSEALASPSDEVPPHWGGYRLKVEWAEFWQGRENWLQDRLRYVRGADGRWRIQRLVP